MKNRFLVAMLLCAAMTAAVAAPSALEADAPPPGVPEQHAELYRDALRALEENRPDEATALLERFLAIEPRHAGALLDLAITQCELGNARAAERLFREIEARFAPPPGIRDVIAAHRATGCKGTAPRRPGASWVALLARGHDNNVNQGSSFPTFTIGSGSNQIEYELAPEFRPQADGFEQFSLTYLQPLDQGATTAAIQLNARRNDHFHGQDTTAALAAVARTWKLGAWRLNTTAALGTVMLDQTTYQRQQQIQIRISPPLPLPQRFDVALTADASHVAYPTRPAYGGTTYEVGGILGYHGGSDLVQATISGLQDRGTAARPGGDRSGWFSSVQWDHQLRPGWNAEAVLTHLNWRSSSFYSPGLIEQVRDQRTVTARGTLQWYFQRNWSLLSEWRATWNKENITLFQYNGRAVQLSLRWEHP